MDWLQTEQAVDLLKKAGLVLFVAIFAGVVLWLLLRKKSEITRWSELPLEDDPPKNNENHDSLS
ncbi:cbb3-type cytochrome c oxidase subunit 3 [Aeoliella mucimassa]|uniref:Cbb3-type cytochrome oxidase component FixQ n=1 Tax=Aeoliella mucimassa TaxID=2527972 RepID=A0A518AM07_9BACT|nr:cbb3-type cytochrome c oxidase subunit 3 [Aeoliella mucimassa]QDU55757.1 Cbb3-type cytochrome oxidase component FixQ [Aeoliella mucimassa]